MGIAIGVVVGLIVLVVAWVLFVNWYDDPGRRLREGDRMMKNAEMARRAQESADNHAKHPVEYEIIARLSKIPLDQWRPTDDAYRETVSFADDAVYTTTTQKGAVATLKQPGPYVYEVRLDGVLVVDTRAIRSSASHELSRLHESLYDHWVRPERERQAQLANERAKAARTAAEQQAQQQQEEALRQKRRLLDKL